MRNLTLDLSHRAADQQPQMERPGGVVLLQSGAQPQILHMNPGLGIQHHTAKNTAESEKVLIFQPRGAAVLVNLHAQPVALLPDVGGQIKVGRREAILGIAHKVPVEPHIECPLHPLKADADGFAQQAGFQIKGTDIAAHAGAFPVDFRRADIRTAIPWIQGVDVLDLTIALQFHMCRHLNAAKRRIIITLLPEILRAAAGIPAPSKFPASIQRLVERGFSPIQLLFGCVANMIRVGIQTVDPKQFRIRQPVEVCLHSALLLYSISCRICQDAALKENIDQNDCHRGAGAFTPHHRYILINHLPFFVFLVLHI